MRGGAGGSVGGRTPSGGGGKTPLRDAMGINKAEELLMSELADEHSQQAGGGSNRRKGRGGSRGKEGGVMAALNRLPAPQNDDIEVVLPEEEAEGEAGGQVELEPDAADLDEARATEAARQEALRLSRRSVAVQRSLPRPPNALGSMFDLPAGAEAAEATRVAIQSEMSLLLARDAVKHPMPLAGKGGKRKRKEGAAATAGEGEALANGSKKKKKSKKKRKRGEEGEGEADGGGSPGGELLPCTDEQLAHARALVADEAAKTGSASAAEAAEFEWGSGGQGEWLRLAACDRVTPLSKVRRRGRRGVAVLRWPRG